ncbi:MAG TPA: TonB-dependent receptor plug domain-containing protein, partial [Stenotrophomonas sp.]|nr:TonB-dependent receptor plug domain-containing protein [Stenotrophomonas sp.]
MNCKSNTLRDAVVLALVVGAGGTATEAFAQDAGNPTNLDRIEVTGSRIRGSEMETQQPIISLDRQTLERQGFTSVADVLQNLTSAGSPAISRADALASGENVGGYYIDIRNLGAERTLILMNGKRLGATTSGLQDLSQIPFSAIERIDILKDGASSIYGSDAIAAVVNVITRKRFDGAEASAYVGQFSEGDSSTEQYSMTLGAQGERGGVTLSAEYYNQDPVFAKNRDFSAYGNAGPDYPGSGWSPISLNGSWCDPRVYNDCVQAKGEPVPVWRTLNQGGNPADPTAYHPITAAEYANSNQEMFLQTGIERKSLYVNANYDLTEKVTFNADILYNQRVTDQQIAGYPYQSQSFDTPLSGTSVFNPIGQDIEFRRRLWEMPRTTRSEMDTLRFAPTISGSFEVGDHAWDWDVGALWNRNKSTKTAHGDA